LFQLHNHPQAESIRKYSRALGLTAQEQMALCKNPALLDTLHMEKANPTESKVEKLIKKRSATLHSKKGQEEQCSIM
jgi:hypothetical protein